MHFRIRRKVVQLIRTSYDASTQKPKAAVVASLPLRDPQLTDEVRRMLTDAEAKEAEAWILNHGRVETLRDEFATLTLAENLQRAVGWLGRNRDSAAAHAAVGHFLPALNQMRKTLRELGFV